MANNRIQANQSSYYFLLFCLIAAMVVVYFIIRPFLTPLILAAVFAFLFQPVYQKILNLTRKRAGLSALTTATIAIILVILPIILLGSVILKESTELYQVLVSQGNDGITKMVDNATDWVKSISPISQNFELNINQYVQQGLKILVQNLGNIFSSLAKILLHTFIFIIAFYFFLKDGRKLKDYFVSLSPLADSDDELIVSRLESIVSATIKGNLTIGLIQGVLTGIGFALFGIPNPALWGGVTAIAALVPGVGTALIITPAVIFLLLTGHTFEGIGLLAWGTVAVGLIDNLLGPKLIGRNTQLHPLAIFLAVIGGLAFFGPLGFILGPLAISVCLGLINIYFALKNKN